jgi:hypothetical protein
VKLKYSLVYPEVVPDDKETSSGMEKTMSEAKGKEIQITRNNTCFILASSPSAPPSPDPVDDWDASKGPLTKV